MSTPVDSEKAPTYTSKICQSCLREFKSWKCYESKYCSNNCRYQGMKEATKSLTKRVCTRCNKTLLVDSFSKGQGYYKSTCKSCHILDAKISPKRIFSSYKSSAKTRKGSASSFELTFEQFMTFWQKPCHYCGDPIKTIGLDRTDNNRGYGLSNVVSCCRRCNFMKWSLDLNAFVNHCRKIARNTYAI